MPAQKITPQIRAQRLLKGAMAQQGLTMDKLAKRLGYAYNSVISDWFADIYNVKLSNVIRVCTILKVDIRDILDILDMAERR